MDALGQLDEVVAAACGAPVTHRAALGGGDVARSFRIDVADGRRVFAKTHDDPPPGFFTTEAIGLRWLAEPGAIGVPTVIAVSDEPPVLVLEWINEGPPAGDEAEADLGRALAGLHRAGASCFGREDRRTTGSRALPNEPCSTWAKFYATQRLLPLARLASQSRALGETSVAGLEDLASRLVDVGGPIEPPARLHGDLWAGNRLVDRSGASWLIDPAAHGGHREFDLAMMRLFGGFGDAAFRAYDETYPLADGWEVRVPLHQLAPLVVHAIKFGGGYRAAVEAVLDRYR